MPPTSGRSVPTRTPSANTPSASTWSAPRRPGPWRRRLRTARRRLLRHRRTLSAGFAGIAVVATLQALSAPPGTTTAVLVAARDLPAGTTLRAGDLRRTELPDGALPAGLATDPAGRVLASPLRSGEPVTDVRLVSPALARAQPGARALPVRLPDAGVAELLRPGDAVDLIATDPADGSARTVATGVRVLALPSGSGDGPGGDPAGALVVLEVNAAQTLAITSASLVEFLSVAM